MTIEQLGNLGEFVSAIAVLITLIYLAKQVSDAKFAIRRQSTQDINTMFNSLNQVVASNPELADAIAKLEEGEEVTKAQAVQVRAMFVSQMNGFENLFVQWKDFGTGLTEDEVFAMIQEYLSQPWAGSCWEDHQVYFSQQFKDFVNSNREGT